MSSADFWQNFGFEESPFGTLPLGADEKGSRLLVGRDEIIEDLHDIWLSSSQHVALEGENGVGKTSLVQVAIYRLSQSAEEQSRSGQSFFSLEKPIQFESGDNFEMKAVRAIAEAIIKYRERFEYDGHELVMVDEVEKILKHPFLTFKSGGLQISGFGGSAGVSGIENTQHFTVDQFRALVSRWLESIFADGRGAFIGVLDNMELAGSSRGARESLENMRDGLLSMPHVKWVFCGSNGVIRSGVASPRLSGRIAEPIQLGALGDSYIRELIETRYEYFRNSGCSRSGDRWEPPIVEDDFLHLYEVLGKNLRNSLKYCEDYVRYLKKCGVSADAGIGGSVAGQLEFRDWVIDQGRKLIDATSLSDKNIAMFKKVMQSGGRYSPSDDAKFNQPDRRNLKYYTDIFEERNLVTPVIDEKDGRKKNIEATPQGWLLYHYLKQ